MITQETYDKVAAIDEVAHASGLKYFVETGSATGGIIGELIGLRNGLEWFWTVELDYDAYRSCIRRFLLEPQVKPIYGDSGVVLQEICQLLPGPAVWFLDAHYNEGHTRGPKDCPLLDELAHIFYTTREGHWILVDDGRLMGVEPGYPSLAEIRECVDTLGGGAYVVKPDYAGDVILIRPA